MRNGQVFKPTAAMRLYAYQRAKLGEDVTNRSIAKNIGVNAETISRWNQHEGFEQWLESQTFVFRAPILELLEQVAVSNLDDYRYWEAMAKKYGFITGDAAPLAQPNEPKTQPTQDQVLAVVEKMKERKSA